MTRRITCGACGSEFCGHGNRSLCNRCRLEYNADMQNSRVEFNRAKPHVKRRDNNACVQCGSGAYLEVHHIVELSKGGSNDLENMVTLCRDCHLREHSLRIPRKGRW